MKTITPEERRLLIDDIAMQHTMGVETLGMAIRRLRLEVTGLDQETFAAMCRMSTKALYLIEKDKGNPTINVIDGILRKFGLNLGLVRSTQTTGMPSERHKQVSKAPVRGASPQRKRVV
ncbi:helix-turn-helix domain-containing protein [Pseudomonas panipatensis]|uniref:helix-turn-helix domain-containing protein n=1 Tax=Pseudomonas panipatensis TaxID=428992 RepID=UPI0035B17DEF